MDFKKLKDKKTLSAIITLLFALLASFGLDLGGETQEFVRDIVLGLVGGGATGAAITKKIIKGKIEKNTLMLDAGIKALDGRVEALTAKASAKFGDDFSAFVEGELNPIKDELKGLVGVEWDF